MLHEITNNRCVSDGAERSGWWLFEEGLILPKKRDKIGRYVVIQVTYTGNSKHHEQEPWKNWSCLLNPIGLDTTMDLAEDQEDSPVATRKKRRADNVVQAPPKKKQQLRRADPDCMYVLHKVSCRKCLVNVHTKCLVDLSCIAFSAVSR